MTTIDNSKIFLDGIFGDATVTVAAETTLEPGTILGLNSSGKLVAYSTDLDNGYTPATANDPAVQAYTSEPTYILAQTLTNDDESDAVDVDMVRVFESGNVDAAKVIFAKNDDATDPQVLAKLKNNGFNLVNVQQMA